MAVEKYLMGIDIGTGGGRCFIFDLNGKEVASAYREWAYLYPNIPYAVEFDPKEMWSTIKFCIVDALSKSKINPSKIMGISSTSMREGIVLLDKEGKEIYAAPNMDWRGFKEAEEAEKTLGEMIYEVSGRWPAPLLAPYRMLWLKKHQVEKYNKVDAMLMLSDWVLYKLANVVSSEPSIASSSGLLDIRRRKWSEEIIEWLKLPKDIFPRVYEGGEQVGELTKEVAYETGLKVGTPVIAGGADTQCGLLGTASIEEGQTTIVAGTTTPVQMVVNSPLVSKKKKLWTGAHATKGRWVLESNAILTGLAFRWYRDAVSSLEKSMAQILQVDPYEIINKEIESVPPGSNGVFAVFSSVFDGAQTLKVRSRGSFFGLNGTRPELTGRKEMARAMIENTCYAVLANCLQLEECSDMKIKDVRICGGAAKSKIWTKIQADIIGRPVYVPQVKEATALGVAMCAGVGAGIYKNISEAASSLVHWETVQEPDKSVHPVYQDLFWRWRRLHDIVFQLTVDGVLSNW